MRRGRGGGGGGGGGAASFGLFTGHAAVEQVEDVALDATTT
eukprot:SAG11_NODE_2294_length_3556_cov_3.734741_3_plen_41_part_00